jgi:hypothetical protein
VENQFAWVRALIYQQLGGGQNTFSRRNALFITSFSMLFEIIKQSSNFLPQLTSGSILAAKT